MTPEQLDKYIELKKQIFIYFLTVSNERGYASPESCASYLNSTVAGWKAEAEAFNMWRDSAYQILNVIQNQAEQSGIIPSYQEVVSQLPVMVWPSI